MIYHNVWIKLKPCDWAASNCPLEMEFKPPRTISAITAEVNKEMAKTETAILFPFTVK